MSSILFQKLFTPETKQFLYTDDCIITDRERLETYPFHLIVSIDQSVQQPLIWSSGSNLDLIAATQGLTFDECLQLLPNKRFNALLFLLTTYQSVRFSAFKNILHPKFRTDLPDPIAQLTEASFGYVLFHHQFEQLYALLTGCNSMQAVTFRKDWNRKLRSAREEAGNIKISHNLTLADMLADRCLCPHQFVYQPNYNAAFRLWKHIHFR